MRNPDSMNKVGGVAMKTLNASLRPPHACTPAHHICTHAYKHIHMCTTFFLSLFASVGGQVGSIHFLASADINTDVQVPLWYVDLESFGYRRRSNGPDSNSVFTFLGTDSP